MSLQKKNFFKSLFTKQILFTIAGMTIITLISIPLAKNVTKQYKVNKEIDILKNEIANLGEKNSQFKNLISYMQSDQFVEEKARLNLNYRQPGESVVVIKNEDKKETAASGDKNEVNIALGAMTGLKNEKLSSNLQRWFKYFFKY
ncbi:MAG: Septum formation initiator [Parcubacteria group bacterium ADurb.Bin316]|nr:MAG: Septum formation initiator [Parcubacteria group bacterium ADurb.Bin316]HOZ56428.1 septum formation initiator family protein [bacterium]